MNLPNIQPADIRSYLDREDVIVETAAQIMKDFGMFGVEIHFSGNVDEAYRELHDQLVEQVDTLLTSHADLLMSILYQVDITDRDILRTQADFPQYNQIEMLAHQIIFRDLKKVLFRRYFKMKDIK